MNGLIVILALCSPLDAEIAAAPLKIGDKVRVLWDSDGAAALCGTVRKAFRSGRCMIEFPDGALRNIAPEHLERVA